MLHRSLLPVLTGIGLLTASMSASAGSQGPTALSTYALSRQQGSAYTPQQVQTAYGITPLLSRGIDGSGQTIALIEFDSFNSSDLQRFDADNQLPDPRVQQVYVGGHSFPLGTSGETTLDLEWAHALAPGAVIQVYYVPDGQSRRQGWKSVGAAVRAAVATGVGTISMSFGACNASSGYTATRQALSVALQHGVSVFVSSGDTGARPGPIRQCGAKLGVAYPASDPSVVSVGGTTLSLNDDGSIATETAWRLSGGGKGAPLPRPAWQITTNLNPGKYRYVPDVAFVGNPATGVEVLFHGVWHQAGGTSLGAPAWAAIWALIRRPASRGAGGRGALDPVSDW